MEDSTATPSIDNSPKLVEDLHRSGAYSDKLQDWANIKDFLNKWYHKPDFGALELLLSLYVSHFYLEDKPAWSFLLGESGTGKSEIGIKALEFLPSTQTVTELTTSTFLSGFGDGNGLLARLTRVNEGNGILLFSDLTPLLQEKPDVRGKIIGILRRIYDGSYEKEIGNKKNPLSWHGKITTIAACTPILEHYWGVYQNLGERFLTIRWKADRDLGQIAYKAAKQIGHERYIHRQYNHLITKLVDYDTLRLREYELTSEASALVPLSMLVARCRVQVDREIIGYKRKVVNVGKPEAPTRIMKSLANVAKGHATLFRKPYMTDADLRLVRRFALDSIPLNRAAILNRLTKSYPNWYSSTNLREETTIPKTTYYKVIEDLECLNIIKSEKMTDDTALMVQQEFADLWQEAMRAAKRLRLVGT